MPTKTISLRIDESMYKYLVARAEAEHRTLSNEVIHMLCLCGCTGCQHHERQERGYKCSACDRELSGFISTGNPIPNWCPIIEQSDK